MDNDDYFCSPKIFVIMKKTLILLSFGILVLTSACQKSTEEINKELYNQVMDIHDEMMPKMGEFHTLRKELGQKIASSDSASTEFERLKANLALVDSADNSMRVWMRGFEPEKHEGKELTDYLKSELVQVTEMKAIMNRALKLKETSN